MDEVIKADAERLEGTLLRLGEVLNDKSVYDIMLVLGWVLSNIVVQTGLNEDVLVEDFGRIVRHGAYLQRDALMAERVGATLN